jgi:hypothetical protein
LAVGFFSVWIGNRDGVEVTVRNLGWTELKMSSKLRRIARVLQIWRRGL